MSDLNIYQRLSAITADISSVAKNLEVGQGRSSYKAVGEADVLAAVKPAEETHGVYSYPVEREIIESAVLTTQSEYQGRIQEKKQQFMRLKVVYRFVNMDKPEEYVDITTFGDGVDSQDKAPGKAMTYADKYALLKAYKIITGEDPDQTASETLSAKEPKRPQQQARTPQREPERQRVSNYRPQPENAPQRPTEPQRAYVEMATIEQIDALMKIGREDADCAAYIRSKVRRWNDLTYTDAAQLLKELSGEPAEL